LIIFTNRCSTYNHYYTDNLQKRRQDKYEVFTRNARKIATTKVKDTAGAVTSSFNTDIFQREMTKSVQRDMDTFAAEETLESSRAYYKVRPILLPT
jgi:hypothetical protein